MKKRRIYITVFATIFSLFISSSLAQAGNPPRKILSGWIPYYSMKTSLPSAMSNADLISEVSPFWYTLKNQNTITDLYTPANPSVPMAGPIAQLQSAGYKILPTITDGTNTNAVTGKPTPLVLSNLLADPSSRASIVSTIVNLVMSNKFDGIDLDFESFAFVDPLTTWPTTQVRWVQFIQDLSTALHAQGKLLSITTPVSFDPASGKKGYYQYAWPQVASMIDQLHIMAYDFSTTSPGPIGPLDWATRAITYAVSVIPASKVYVGIPGYGRDWVTSVSGVCPTLPVNYAKTVAKGVSAVFAMHDATALAAAYGASPTFNPQYAESTFTYQKTYNGTAANGSLTTCTATRTVWYQDQQSFTLRANLINTYRLAGISEWTLGMEDPLAFTAIRTVAASIAPDQVVAGLNVDATLSTTGITLGTPTTITGTFTLPDKSPIAGAPAHLQVLGVNGVWTNIFDGITAADGTFTVPVLWGSNVTTRMIMDGTWTRLEGDTTSLAVKVARVISWSPPSSIKSGVAYTVTGQIQPRVAGITVNLGIVSTANSHLTPMTTTTDTNGNFSFVLNNTAPGFYTYQVSTPEDASYILSTSPFVTVVTR